MVQDPSLMAVPWSKHVKTCTFRGFFESEIPKDGEITIRRASGKRLQFAMENKKKQNR